MAKRKGRFAHDIHQYGRIKESKREDSRTLWRCYQPNCSHYVPEDMVIGRLTLCNRCKTEVFKMTREHLVIKKPHCPKCTRPYNNKGKKEVVEEINVTDLLKGI